VPTVSEEDDRRLHRERDRLINERGQHMRPHIRFSAAGITVYQVLRRPAAENLRRSRSETSYRR
jgi:transposase